MYLKDPPSPKGIRSRLLIQGNSFRPREPPRTPPRAPPQELEQVLHSATFNSNFHTYEEWARYECFYAKRKIREIRTIKMTDFTKAKFKYLTTFEKFGSMPYLTIQHPVHENLIWVFFSNATLEDAGEKVEDPCRIVAINTFVMGMPIRVYQGDVAIVFKMPEKSLDDDHAIYPPTMLIFNDNALDLQLHDRLLHLFISHFFPTHRAEAYQGAPDWLLVCAPCLSNNQINLLIMIFQDLIKVVRGSIKTIPHGMHLSHIIRRARCNIDVDHPLLQFKYISFDKHAFGHMQ